MFDELAWKSVPETYSGQREESFATYRAAVPGGWLVAVWATEKGNRKWGGGLTFVPDPEHRWTVACSGQAA